MKPASLEAIATELLRVHGLSEEKRAAEGSRRIRPVEVGAERYPVSPRLEALIVRLTEQACAENPDIRPREAAGKVQQALRAAVAACGLNPGRRATPAGLARKLSRQVAASLDRLRGAGARRTIVIGCTLLPWDDFEALTVGPVRFRARLDWLHAEAALQGLSATGLRRVEARWRGERRGGRRASRDATVERGILDAVGDSRFVCSVATRDLSEQAALDRSLDAARLTLAGLALLWEQPARALAGMTLRYDRVPFQRSYLAAADGRLFAGGGSWTEDRNGAWMSKAAWQALLRRNPGHLRQLGEVMDDAVAAQGEARRPRLSAMLYEALLWFEAGCREETDRFAVAKFAAALEALAEGPGPLAAEALDAVAALRQPDTGDWPARRDAAEAAAARCLRGAFRAAAEAPRDDPALLTGA